MNNAIYPRRISQYRNKWGLLAECWEVAPNSLETGFTVRAHAGTLETDEQKIHTLLRRIYQARHISNNLGIVDGVTKEALYLRVEYGQAFLTLGETQPIEPDLAACIANQNEQGISRLLVAIKKAANKREVQKNGIRNNGPLRGPYNERGASGRGTPRGGGA